MERTLNIVLPVYNDWDSVELLIKRINLLYSLDYDINYVIVDDASTKLRDISNDNLGKYKIRILDLKFNMGHQRALAIGLSYVNANLKGHTVVMDSDGEDLPDDITKFFEERENFKGVIFAKRSKRSEGNFFRLFYKVYKYLFYLLTGKKISFGNFSFIPSNYLERIVYIPEIWSHYSGGILRSGIPHKSVPTNRGTRYYGKSKMNFVRLVLHGLSAVSVYVDIMSMRLILFCGVLLFLILFSILAVVLVKVFTELAIPGWASNIVLGLSVLFVFVFFVAVLLLFNVLSLRIQRTIVPAVDYQIFIYKVKVLEV